MGRIVASIEARMTSSRLPGKVLADLAGEPALTRLYQRLAKSQKIDGIILATTINATDDPLAEWAAQQGIDVYRGSEVDVLDRVVKAQQQMNSDIVVEICGDTPLLDPDIIDQAVELFLEGNGDVITTSRKETFPQGIDVEVFSLYNLEEVAATVQDPAVREHVSLYFYDHPERYRIYDLIAPRELFFPDQRLQVDYPEDLELVRKIYTRLLPIYGPDFTTRDIITLLQQEPSLGTINAHCEERAAR